MNWQKGHDWHKEAKISVLYSELHRKMWEAGEVLSQDSYYYGGIELIEFSRRSDEGLAFIVCVQSETI